MLYIIIYILCMYSVYTIEIWTNVQKYKNQKQAALKEAHKNIMEIRHKQKNVFLVQIKDVFE